MFTIKKLNSISEAVCDYLAPERYALLEDAQSYDAILVRSAKCHGMCFPEEMVAVARAGAGVNNIPIDECTKQGIVVFNTPGANANGVKELVLTGMLVASRNLIEAVQWAKTLSGKGEEVLPLVEKGKNQFVGPELNEKTLGVIGLGAIGVMVANAAHSLGMNVIGYDPYISVESAWGLSRGVGHAYKLDELLEKSDYITIHIPLMDATKGFLGAKEIAKMKEGVILLNFARNGLIEYAPLYDAMNSGRVARYVTDFPSAALLSMDNAICIPHLGASTPESEENCAKMAAIQLRDYLETGDIVNSVNLPSAQLAFTGNYRIAVIHKNVTGMVGQITALLAQLGANITDMMNKSKGDIAYTIINLDDAVPERTVEAMRGIEGVVRVRTFER